MRINVVINDELMAQAMALSGLQTKRAVIEEALRTLITVESQEQVRELKGELHWDGDFNVIRESRHPFADR